MNDKIIRNLVMYAIKVTEDSGVEMFCDEASSSKIVISAYHATSDDLCRIRLANVAAGITGDVYGTAEDNGSIVKINDDDPEPELYATFFANPPKKHWTLTISL